LAISRGWDDFTTIIGNPDVLGNAPGWNMDEFLAVLKENPGADIPMGAWSFIRSLMTEQRQRQVITESPNYIPLNKAVFDWMIERAMTQTEHTINIGTSFGGKPAMIDVTISPLSQAEADRFMEMLNSAIQSKGADDILSSILDIVTESASGYFAGQSTAQDVAGIIQSRASILASEQFG